MENVNSQSDEISILGEYLDRGDSYYQERITDMFTIASLNGRFDDLHIPLDIFDWATDAFSSSGDSPVGVLREFIEIMNARKLTENQRAIIIVGILAYFKEATFIDDNTGLPRDYSLVKRLLDMELDRIAIARNAKKAKKYNWMDTMRKVDSLESFSEKISYLIEQRTRYDQAFGSRPDGPNFGNNCDLEIKKLESQRELSKSHIDHCPPQRSPKPQPEPLTQKKYSQQTIALKPLLKPEAVPVVFGILKDFFDPSQQAELERILKTFDNASSKLLFKDNGNRLTDTFKKLKESDFITGCEKEDLTNWIVANFRFVHRKTDKPYLSGTVEKTMSGNNSPCQNPLIEIIGGEIQKPKKPYQKPCNRR